MIISKIGVETEPVAVWRVSFRTAVPAAAWRVFVDGSSKRVVSKYNVAQYQEPRGSVFAPNPVRTSRNPTLKDDPAGIPDGDSDELTKARSSVAINDLETGGNGLVGKYAVIVPSNLGTSPAFEPTGVFDYRRSDPRFEDVMAYHWVTENQRYVQSLGFEKAGNFQIRIDTHFTAADNSYYDPDEKSLQFGTGEVDDAEDGEVIIHEYAHAILDDQVPNFGGNQEGTEARAISEGFGDYWAASFLPIRALRSGPYSGPNGTDRPGVIPSADCRHIFAGWTLRRRPTTRFRMNMRTAKSGARVYG
ncbi:MAG: hypothetical protein IPK58_24395 [Acidobacteria bacterium]|nr:hypothetical protein [Acidobacteriota bacterium]